MNTLYVTRHGQTQDNVKQIIQGRGDSELTDAGISSLHERAAKLAAIQFDSIYCSPLPRARKSLSILVPCLHYSGTIHFQDELQEIDFGVYTRQPLAQLKTLIQYHKSHPDIAYPEGESGNQLIQRVRLFIDTLNQQSVMKTCLIMTHFGVLETILTCYAGENFASVSRHKDDIAQITFHSQQHASLKWL
jgi:probable phosphoglycerate mutase